ncbi:MAG: L-threonylcarbamoyladenylate synthase [Succinivibrio sp.]
MVEFTSDLQKAASCIRSGGVAVCPAEGVYGISCLAGDDNAVRRIIAMKERDSSKGLITVASCREQLEGMWDPSSLPGKARDLMDSLWPGPFTFVVPCSREFSGSALTGGRGTIAVRLTAFKTLADLCDLCSSALVTTSANLSGMEAVSDFSLISPLILKRADVALDLPCQGLEGASSVYDAVSGTLIRRGPSWPEDK